MKVQELQHSGLKKWIEDAAALMGPDSVEVCDGSKAEYDRMIQNPGRRVGHQAERKNSAQLLSLPV